MKIRIVFFLLFVALFSQCKPEKENIQSEIPLPEDFEVFFNRFHQDSLYQIEHITFPLEGIQKVNEGPGSILVPIKWHRDEWIMHRPFNDHNGSFSRSYRQAGPIIIEFINDQNNFFSMERRFARMDKEWYLIYYGLK